MLGVKMIKLAILTTVRTYKVNERTSLPPFAAFVGFVGAADFSGSLW